VVFGNLGRFAGGFLMLAGLGNVLACGLFVVAGGGLVLARSGVMLARRGPVCGGAQ
jgi:hypothetical protein